MELKFRILAIKQVECHFAVNHDFIPEKDKPVEIGYGINISIEKKDKNVTVVVSVVSDNKTQPCVFNITTSGLFSFNKVPQKQELDKVARVNCASIIFPYIRESLADLTRRAGLPPLHLDPVNFVSIYEQERKDMTEKKATDA